MFAAFSLEAICPLINIKKLLKYLILKVKKNPNPFGNCYSEIQTHNINLYNIDNTASFILCAIPNIANVTDKDRHLFLKYFKMVYIRQC